MILRNRKLLRTLLLILGVLAVIFLPDFFDFPTSIGFMIFYSVFVIALILITVFGNFRLKKRSAEKIRKDIEIAAPDPTVVFSRDHRKDALEKEDLLQFIFNVSTDAFWKYDLSTGKVFWSDHAVQVIGVKDLQSSFDPLISVMFESDQKMFRQVISDALKQRTEFNLEVRVYDDVEGLRTLSINGKPQINAEGHLIRMVGTLSDISEQKVTKQNLIYNVYHDTLTGLKNRRFFLEHLDEEMVRTKNRPDYLFALIFLDIDRFNGVNDSFGYQFGDGVLREVANRLIRFSRNDSLVARIDGDEFGIILKNLNGRNLDENLKSVVCNLQSKLKTEIVVDGQDVLLNVSMAVIINSGFDDVESLITCADTTLKQAKKTGSGTIQFFSSGIREKAMELYRLEIEIRKAIQYQEFILVYQPIINVKKGKLAGFEALVRWKSSGRGIIPPSDFIPMAEETGLIISMGEQILRMACSQAKEWVDAGYTDLWVAVNFSAKQFALDNVMGDVSRILTEVKLPPKNLKLEITEYTAMNDSEKIEEVMKQLSKMGVQISIDDFGTGYSSLVYLKRYPIRTLKIDRSFIKGIPLDSENSAIAKMVISMGKALNLELIAEGVETREQLDFLRAEGCDLIQGFYYSKPLFGEDATRLIKAYSGKQIPIHVEERLISPLQSI